ncbi:hypothetical protein [Duganella radicis]|uniref:Uncharacterized protein n=1 Tax=Duganella radicis TaxID=551988 RepID=A0A6L6PSB0_9BURK|nr:hypothetical protein [Duganella radicis]MTV41679.1 hypothetical protein [Duganella radicis]
MHNQQTNVFGLRKIMKRKTQPVMWYDISVSVGGQEVSGSYSVDSTDWMTVRMNGGGSKSARGGPGAEGVARLILCELFAESKRQH